MHNSFLHRFELRRREVENSFAVSCEIPAEHRCDCDGDLHVCVGPVKHPDACLNENSEDHPHHAEVHHSTDGATLGNNHADQGRENDCPDRENLGFRFHQAKSLVLQDKPAEIESQDKTKNAIDKPHMIRSSEFDLDLI